MLEAGILLSARRLLEQALKHLLDAGPKVATEEGVQQRIHARIEVGDEEGERREQGVKVGAAVITFGPETKDIRRLLISRSSRSAPNHHFSPILPHFASMKRQIAEGEREHDHNQHSDDAPSCPQDVVRGLRNWHHFVLTEHGRVAALGRLGLLHLALVLPLATVVIVGVINITIVSVIITTISIITIIVTTTITIVCIIDFIIIVSVLVMIMVVTVIRAAVRIGLLHRIQFRVVTTRRHHHHVLHRDTVVQLARTLPQRYRYATVQQL